METLSFLCYFQEMRTTFRGLLFVESVRNDQLLGSEDFRDVRSPFIVPFGMLVLPVPRDDSMHCLEGVNLIRS